MAMLNRTFILFMGLGLASCGSLQEKNPPRIDKPEYAGSLLRFSERSADEPEHLQRVLITDRYVRFDAGRDNGDYILFDRNERRIYNVVAEDGTILVLGNKNVSVKPDFPMGWQISSEASQALPRSGGQSQLSARHVSFKLNGKACYNVVSLVSGYEMENQALQEFYQTLARELKTSYRPQVDSPCFAAIMLFEPVKRFAYGFPFREWSVYGYQRFLQNAQQKIIFPKTLFELPADYQRIE